MPGMHSAMTLDLTKVDQCHEQAWHGLNTLAYKLIDKGPVQNFQVTWENLNFQEFGPQPICVLTEQIKLDIELESPVESPLQSALQVQDLTSELADSAELFQSGSDHSVSEPISIPTACAYESPMDSDELGDDDELPGVLPAAHCHHLKMCSGDPSSHQSSSVALKRQSAAHLNRTLIFVLDCHHHPIMTGKNSLIPQSLLLSQSFRLNLQMDSRQTRCCSI